MHACLARTPASPHTHRPPPPMHGACADYGVVACWGLTEGEEQEVIAKLARPCMQKPLAAVQVQVRA
jgi:hypothetical protein